MRMPRRAGTGVVGPTGHHRPDPRGHRRIRRALVIGAAAVGLLASALASSPRPTGTEALFTFRAQPQVNSIQGAIWAPDPPAACGDVARYDGILYGTLGDDVMYGGNQPQIIMGIAGNDRILGGNSGDCLVGGSGDDRLFGGNAKDVLLGGPGNDYLDGGNAKDYLDGEDDADECDGGNGQDDVINCDAPPLLAPSSLQPTGEPTEADPDAPRPTVPTQPADPVPTAEVTPPPAVEPPPDAPSPADPSLTPQPESGATP